MLGLVVYLCVCASVCLCECLCVHSYGAIYDKYLAHRHAYGIMSIIRRGARSCHIWCGPVLQQRRKHVLQRGQSGLQRGQTCNGDARGLQRS